MRASTSASQALGSTPESFANSIIVYKTAARWPPEVGAAEGPISSAYRYTAQRALGRVVRQADAAVVEEARERLPVVERVVDRLGQRPFRGELLALAPQPCLEAVHERLRP